MRLSLIRPSAWIARVQASLHAHYAVPRERKRGGNYKRRGSAGSAQGSDWRRYAHPSARVTKAIAALIGKALAEERETTARTRIFADPWVLSSYFRSSGKGGGDGARRKIGRKRQFSAVPETASHDHTPNDTPMLERCVCSIAGMAMFERRSDIRT